MAELKTVIPWGLHPLDGWVMDELKRRAKEYNQNPGLDTTKPYSGPRTAWARVFSNGKSKNESEKVKGNGFVMGGIYGFNDSYGFNESGKTKIGVDAKGNPHEIEDGFVNFNGVKKPDFPKRPPPSLESVSCELSGANSGFPNLCRKVTFNWKCHTLAQLNYMIPYFLTPRITCLVEWGWNNYDTVSLVDLEDLDWLNSMFTDPTYTTEYIEKSNGNYDAGIGFIVDYGYKMNEMGGYDCYTTILNANKLIEGEQINNKVVTVKLGNTNEPAMTFKEFLTKHLKSIDSPSDIYKNLRKELKLETDKIPISHRVFRIDSKESSENKSKGLWIRMDLVQDIINGFFMNKMRDPQNATIKEFNITDIVVSAHPFLKSIDRKVLIPNQYARRFTAQDPSSKTQPATVEDGSYLNLFKERVKKISDEYGVSDQIDNLKEAINPNGNSFPVYEPFTIKDKNGKETGTIPSGYWGYLKDIFIEDECLIQLASDQDSLLKFIEHLLERINESVCQITKLKLIANEYANNVYSVNDQSLPGTVIKEDAAKLPKITLGSLSSAYIKAASLDVKISAEMMNQLVMQSANPSRDPNGQTYTKNVSANPIISRYSEGDRLYSRGVLETTTGATGAVAVQNENGQPITAEQKEKNKKEFEKRKLSRNEKNFLKYYKKDSSNALKTYILCETDKEFLNYVLNLPDKNSTFLNNAIMPGTTLTLEFMGISGIDYLSQFVIDHAPETYSYENAVWQVADVRHSIEDKNWTTTIVAQVRPLTIL